MSTQKNFQAHLTSTWVEVSNTVWPIQKNRCSGNISTQNLKGSKLKWTFETPGGTFKIMKDMPMGNNPCIFDSIVHGAVTAMVHDEKLYAANPAGMMVPTKITVEGID